MRALAILVLLASAVAGPGFADTDDAAARTSRQEIKSRVLGETRQIYVRTPPAYDPAKSYPVVYVLDGEWEFEFVAGYLDFMFDNEVMPDVIVTGVRNVNRNRDYVPRADPNYPYTGEADRFLKFVEDEWIGFIDSAYPASGERIIVGHSFGGVFALHAFFKKPELFDANIALGASAWVADRILFEEAEALFKRRRPADGFVYMAVGEGDGGPTVPSSRDLVALFEEKAPKSVEWKFSVTPQTDHFTNVPIGLNEAFMALFPTWGFRDELKARAGADGADGARAWFAEKRAALGWRFQPQWFDLSIVAMQLGRDGGHDAAIAIMEEMLAHYPDSAYVVAFAASVYEGAGQFEEAASQTRRAIAIAREKDLDPNAIQISNLEAELERIEAAMASGD